MSVIRISWPRGQTTAKLRDTPTARKLLSALPLQSRANTWGEEVYFSLPFSAEAEHDASDVVAKGAVCFWLDGSALALLFGPTPISVAGECRLISAANIVGMLDGESGILRSGDAIKVEEA